MKGKIVPLILTILGLGLFLTASPAWSEDSTASPYNQVCSSTKTGRLVISPTSLQFYVNQEQLENPQPITIRLTGFALPNCVDGNCTTEKMEEFTYDANGTVNGTIPRTDDLSAHNNIWAETLDFCWIAAPTEQWIDINGQPAGVAVDSANGNGTFTVTVDVNKLLDSNAVYTGEPTVKEGWIQVTTTIHDPSIPGGNSTYMRTHVDEQIKNYVSATLSDWTVDDDLPVHEQMSTWWIPVKVYVNSLRYAAEEKAATTDWVDLTLNVPISDGTKGALYILAEHPSLSPGQVFAYRWINGKPHFDLFSQWGHPIPGAESLYYARDVQNTPIALPFSDDKVSVAPIPYKNTNVGVSGGIPDVKAFVPVPFGGGIRLIGLEGDWIIRAVVGDPTDIQNYRSWRELLYYVLHITPLKGRWVVTEEYAGDTTTYIDDATGIIYPLTLNEERGKLSGVWLTPKGQTVLTVRYANTSDQVCNQFTIRGQRVLIDNCIRPGKYEIYFTENTIWGPFEYLYRINDFDVETAGKIEGQWQYRALGDVNWSVPEHFTAITEDVVVPLDPNCNCYKVAGKVNGIATPFIVDTGAAMVLLNLNDAEMYGIPMAANGTITWDACQQGTAEGVGGQIEGYWCPVNIEIAGILKKENVPAFLSENQDTALLGMTFLKYFHVSTNANDGTMIISK